MELTTHKRLEIQSYIIEYVLEKSIKDLTHAWDELITENYLRQGASHKHLQINARIVIHSKEEQSRLPRWNRNQIHPSMRKDLEELLEKEDSFNKNHSLISGYLSVLLTRCNTFTDLVSVLPETFQTILFKKFPQHLGDDDPPASVEIPQAVLKYHSKAVKWVETEAVRKFLLGY